MRCPMVAAIILTVFTCILSAEQAPATPNTIYNVRDLGAAGDGQIL